MTRGPLNAALALVLALQCTGCPLTVGTGGFTLLSRCETLTDVAIPASFIGLELQDALIHQRVINFSSNFPADFTDPRSRARYLVRLLSIEVFSTTVGMDDFSFTEGLSLLVSPVVSRTDLPEVVAATYLKDPFAMAVPTLSLMPNPSFDPTGYLRNGDINVSLLFTGTLPVEAFTIDIRFCFSYNVSGELEI